MKKGDIVECINNNMFEERLTVGNIYIINDIIYEEDGIYFNIIDDHGISTHGGFAHKRFTLYEMPIII